MTFPFVHLFNGEPAKGKTKPETILRQLATKKGQMKSVDTVLAMGITQDVSFISQPAGDTGKVDLIRTSLNVRMEVSPLAVGYQVGSQVALYRDLLEGKFKEYTMCFAFSS
ncbi:hypothetical protein OIU77_022319 [Salix suchowensis]|uniref:Uncharacterized protein n=1 Tax=Salix suchowensis TaxID=1278906 RepID=A0ABQ9BZT8_9ROSI|nr:hypothetical protein OIU78_009214 [Salix suchowensis]KAJ6392812.1 hypothetical protein OIU77_022319 [Salix suchowensis]